jgi:hypothetical protein
MKYFTADRYKAFQSRDDDVAEAADQDWEEQIRLYTARLEEIDGKLPNSVKLFMKTCHLHDACFDNWASFGVILPQKAQVVIRQKSWGNFVCILRYKIAPPGYAAQVAPNNLGYGMDTIGFKYNNQDCFDRPEFHPASDSGRPSDWLYDEWEFLGTAEGVLGNMDIFSHSILLSSGTEITIVFSEFEFMYIPVGEGFVESSK